MSEWISVKDRLPEYGKDVLVCDCNSRNYISVWSLEKDTDGGTNYWEDCRGWWQSFDEVTHWMPLPEPPKEDVE